MLIGLVKLFSNPLWALTWCKELLYDRVLTKHHRKRVNEYAQFRQTIESAVEGISRSTTSEIHEFGNDPMPFIIKQATSSGAPNRWLGSHTFAQVCFLITRSICPQTVIVDQPQNLAALLLAVMVIVI